MNEKEPLSPYSVDPIPAVDLGREPLMQTQATLESRTFEVDVALNPLVAAAAPLLTTATALQEQPDPPNLSDLYQLLCHEIKVFENKSHGLGYRSPVILAARYFLCAFIDETLLSAAWGEKSLWSEQNLLKTFQRESWGGERFFVILERSFEDPKPHLDLLELAYLCLSLGYEGKYRNKPKGHHELAQWMDRLYTLIRDESGECSKRLLAAPMIKPKSKNLFSRIPSVWVTIMATVIILVGIYTPYHIHLSQVTAPLRQSLQNLLQSPSPVMRSSDEPSS